MIDQTLQNLTLIKPYMQSYINEKEYINFQIVYIHDSVSRLRVECLRNEEAWAVFLVGTT
jgi:hypothetical protein